jgi:hypothetical protein
MEASTNRCGTVKWGQCRDKNQEVAGRQESGKADGLGDCEVAAELTWSETEHGEFATE